MLYKYSINYEAINVNLFNTTVTRGVIFSSKCTRNYLAAGSARTRWKWL